MRGRSREFELVRGSGPFRRLRLAELPPHQAEFLVFLCAVPPSPRTRGEERRTRPVTARCYKSKASPLGAGPAGSNETSGCGSGVPESRKRLVIG